MQHSISQHRGAGSYLVGLLLALILTVVPFAIVAAGALAKEPTLIVIAVAAVLQVLVHLRWFLHLDLTTTPRENILAMAFAAVLILIMVAGSLWIMLDLHHRMAG
ncbi:MAG: cytochrome o ubiquinol oxidase subunit IV [Hyphomicrobiales bacterium]|nr:cytochrome o ubiquinol oxidase subunit IV [Hyphomicrobiales bacterium]